MVGEGEGVGVGVGVLVGVGEGVGVGVAVGRHPAHELNSAVVVVLKSAGSVVALSIISQHSPIRLGWSLVIANPLGKLLWLVNSTYHTVVPSHCFSSAFNS